MRIGLIIIACFICSAGFSQEVKVNGQFIGDSLRIGEPIPYALSARYPSKLQILFPDSLHEFKPFEYERKNYFPTITSDGISLDSAIYWVSSFEIDSIQFLSIPILQLIGTDSLFHQPKADSVFLSSSTKSVPDNIPPAELPLKSDTDYRTVLMVFNYPLLVIALGISTVILGLVWIVFGKQIRNWWKRRKLKKGFQEFEQAFQQLLDKIKEGGNIIEAEQAIRLWKKYLENLEGIPYTKFTTREILALGQHQEIRGALRSIDHRIYGQKQSEDVNEYYTLKSFTEDQYLKKLEELKK